MATVWWRWVWCRCGDWPGGVGFGAEGRCGDWPVDGGLVEVGLVDGGLVEVGSVDVGLVEVGLVLNKGLLEAAWHCKLCQRCQPGRRHDSSRSPGEHCVLLPYS